MSRKSDIATAREIYMDTPGYRAIDNALEAAYDLGRASVLDSMRKLRTYESAEKTAKRLRARVRKMAEGKR